VVTGCPLLVLIQQRLPPQAPLGGGDELRWRSFLLSNEFFHGSHRSRDPVKVG